jgi:hypothetical protein
MLGWGIHPSTKTRADTNGGAKAREHVSVSTKGRRLDLARVSRVSYQSVPALELGFDAADTEAVTLARGSHCMLWSPSHISPVCSEWPGGLRDGRSPICAFLTYFFMYIV